MGLEWEEWSEPVVTKWTCGRYTLAEVGDHGRFMLSLGTWNMGEYGSLDEAMDVIVRGQPAAAKGIVYPPTLRPVFTFGSNLAGRHGKGAALWARTHCGAIQGQAEGFQGNSYAIPTRTAKFQNLPLDTIEEGLQRWASFTRINLAMHFILTPIGCGLAGHEPSSIRTIVQCLDLKHNVSLSKEWFDHV